MKKSALLLLLFQTVLVFAADKVKANPADFPLKLHITSSASRFIVYTGAPPDYFQDLETVINGQPTRLEGLSNGVLALGDYPARISTKARPPKNPNTYDIYQGYDFLLPDGNVRTFYVTRIGPAVPTNP
jgi:hypothetical protein